MAHRLLLPLLLLLLLGLVLPLNAEACRHSKHSKGTTTTGATETGRLWRFLCDQVISRMDRHLKSDELTSGNKSKDGVTGIKVATATTARPKTGSNTLASARPKVALLGKKVTTTERTRLAHSGNKDKKNLGTNQVIPSQTATASPTTIKTHKDKKAPVLNLKVLRDNEVPSASAAKVEKSQVPSRQHKAFFVNYQTSQRVYQNKEAKTPVPAVIGGSNRKKHKQKQKPLKQSQGGKDSDIYFIRLPPTPYSYVPGLGYISQPPSFSTASLDAAAGKQPQQHHKPRPPPSPVQNPFIKLPIDFVSNGKPTSVYRWPASSKDPQQQQPQHHHYDHNKHQHHNYHPHQKNKPDSPVIRLNRGPYVFDGRPTSVYVMKRNNRPSIPNLF